MAQAPITPLRKLLMSVKLDHLLAFLNQMKLVWDLWREEDGSFRAEIRFGETTFRGSHRYLPHHALAEATAAFLMQAKGDFHEYWAEGEK